MLDRITFPTRYVPAGMEYKSFWPLVKEDNYCGEFDSKDEFE